MSANKRMNFVEFRDLLLRVITENTKREIGDTSFPWLEVGNEKVREAILQTFKQQVESSYDVELVVEPHLVSLDRPIESIAIQLHHVFNTVSLMERINAKIKARRQGR